MPPPVLINCRDRLTSLELLIAWLERAGLEEIVLLDNDSVWPPLLDFYERTPHRVIRLGANLGQRAAWKAGLVPHDRRWIYTDPDVVPTDDCPLDLVDRLAEALDRFPQFVKAGPRLYVDDVDPSLGFIEWERGLTDQWREMAPGGVYSSLIDTTFALMKPGIPFTYYAIRTGAPYEIRHLPWYEVDDLTPETAFYYERAKSGDDEGSYMKDLVEARSPR